MLVDSHAHLCDEAFDQDRDEVIDRAVGAGITAIMDVGYDLDSSGRAAVLAGRRQEVHAAVGISPHDAAKAPGDYLDQLAGLAKNQRVVAIGEIGLDFYYDEPRDRQREVFQDQLELADKLGLPVIIHDRDAHGEILDLLRSRRRTEYPAGVLHCFSGSLEMARECIKMGFFLSVAGPVTFHNARRLAQTVAELPLERLLVETDCPYLTPVPYRGKRNEPANVALVAARIAEIKGLPVDKVARITTENAAALFGLKQPK
ncbi:MAG: TatD family hydrolase [Firmicutes bacterium]|nr:TatD family hydrolase [Bacillota bacterium]